MAVSDKRKTLLSTAKIAKSKISKIGTLTGAETMSYSIVTRSRNKSSPNILTTLSFQQDREAVPSLEEIKEESPE